MEKPIIQSLWIGSELSLFEQLSISSFIANGHEFHLYTYDEIKGIPKGVNQKDANEIIPEANIFSFCKGSYAGFADWFRWALLYKKGNFWVDTDVVCIQPYDFGSEPVVGLESHNRVGTAVLGFPKEHQISRLMEQLCSSPNMFLPYDSTRDKAKKSYNKIFKRGRENIKWGETGGPRGLSRALNYFDIFQIAKPFTYFYPVHYSNWNSIFDETLAKDTSLFANTYSIHLWNEMFRRKQGFDKNGTFPQNSLIEQLKNKYL